MSRRQFAVAVAAGLILSQPGHVLAYVLHFGPDALVLQAADRHAYLPTMLKLTSAALAPIIALLLSLLGMLRMVRGRRNGRLLLPGWPVTRLLVAILAVQMAVYAGQEVTEASAVHMPLPAMSDLLLYGLLGQLPLACLGACAVGWWTAGFEQAFEEIRSRLDGWKPRPTSISIVVTCSSVPLPWLQATAPTVFVKRGPPTRHFR